MNNLRTQSIIEGADKLHACGEITSCGNSSLILSDSSLASSRNRWYSEGELALSGDEAFSEALRSVTKPFFLLSGSEGILVSFGGVGRFGGEVSESDSLPILAYSPAVPPENLGDPAFCRELGLRYPYIGGSMAHGISSVEMVQALGRGGMIGFFGSAGLTSGAVETALDQLEETMQGVPYGFNLIHSPNEPRLETCIADLFIRRGIRVIEASAFLDVTLPVVRYRVMGIRMGPDGEIVTPNRIIAKVSRVEVASKFFSPPPENFLRELILQGDITEEQAALARRIPLAQDVTAEGDSGGHTDSRPAITLLPTLLALRDAKQKEFNYSCKLRVGLGGGISTPSAAAGAFAMGAAYIVTGSVNQACLESGTSPAVREILSQVQQADVTLAPAADMFEMNAKVQVVKRGTMFAMRAAKLSELYRQYGSIEEIPLSERSSLEKNLFRDTLDSIWTQTCSYFRERDTTQLERADANPKHKMALLFRWYLGQASHWAISGKPERKIDYQIWCGPAMGAFNEWTKGTFMEHPRNRRVVSVALNLLHGAAVLLRISSLRTWGVPINSSFYPSPLDESIITRYL